MLSGKMMSNGELSQKQFGNASHLLPHSFCFASASIVSEFAIGHRAAKVKLVLLRNMETLPRNVFLDKPVRAESIWISACSPERMGRISHVSDVEHFSRRFSCRKAGRP